MKQIELSYFAAGTIANLVSCCSTSDVFDSINIDVLLNELVSNKHRCSFT